jgi:biotin carboxylase
LLIETAYGVNRAKETLKAALGIKPDFERKRKKEAFLQYVVVPKEGELIKVTGKNMALNSPGAEHVYVKPRKGSVLTPPASMRERYAYVIGAGESASDARKNAKTGASKIKFHLRVTGGAEHEEPAEAADGPDGSGIHIGMDYFSNNVVCET